MVVSAPVISAPVISAPVISALVVAGSLLLCPIAAADTQETHERPRQASGTFASKSIDFDVWGAYAFEGPVGFNDDDGVHVAISNFEFNTAYVDEFWDRAQWINERFVDSETVVAWFYFTPDGGYEGLSYYFGPGNGCGLCFSSEVDSSVEVRDRRIAGTLRFQDDDGASFDVTFDVPVAPTDFGEPLSEGGGEPGDAYRAYHEALATGDTEAIRPTMESYWASHFEDGQGFIDFLLESHPDSYVIKRGFVQGDRAVLLASGKHRYLDEVRIEVHLLREEGRWVYADELVKKGEW